MSINLTNLQASALARIAAEISMISPIKPAPHNVVVQMPIIYLTKIRAELTAAGIDWEGQAKAYRKFLATEKAMRKEKAVGK